MSVKAEREEKKQKIYRNLEKPMQRADDKPKESVEQFLARNGTVTVVDRGVSNLDKKTCLPVSLSEQRKRSQEISRKKRTGK